MNCSTCGRENPPHLTFCQECGQRLGPRVAPPTPPVGLGAQIGAQYAAAANAGGTQAMEARAPYGPPPGVAAPAPPPPPAAPVAAPAAAPLGAAGAQRRCKVCETLNGPGLRYCTSCGSTLDPSPSAAPAPTPAAEYGPPPVVASPAASAYGPPPVAASPAAPAGYAPAPAFAQAPPAANPSPPQAAPAPAYAPPPPPPAPAPLAAPAPAPAPAPALAPMRVVDVAGTAASPDGRRVCTRCRGTVDPGASFCKFCGAPLGESPVPSAASRLEATPSPAPAAAAPPASAVAAPPASAAPTPRVPVPTGPSRSAPPPAPAAAPAPAPVAQAPVAPVASVAPKPTIHGRLVVIAKSGADGPSYPLTDLLDIGRAEGHIVVPEDAYLSPRHVRIALEDKRLMLRDLASTNGVYLKLSPSRDAARSTRVPARWTELLDKLAPRRETADGEMWVPLEDQDHVLVGQQVLRFEVLREGEAGLGAASEQGTLLFGSPAAPRYARLLQRTVEGITRDVYYVRKVETVLGRESGDVVFTEDPFLSRRHAAIRVLDKSGSFLANGEKPNVKDPLRFALVDLGSSNGTFLRVREPVELVSGDQFRIGQQLFRVDLDEVTSRGIGS